MKLTNKKWILALGLMLSVCSLADDGHEDDPGIIPPVKIKPPARVPGPQAIGGCDIAPGSLSDFASGERYDLHSMVTYLTQPECIEVSRSLSATEMATNGMKFNVTEPINLLNLTQGLTPRDYDSLRKLDASLAKSVPGALRSNPLSQGQLLPLVGQLSLLSPQAARFGMVKLMEQEIFAADPVLASLSSSSSEKKQTAKELARNLVKLGANEPVLISEFASNVEEMAVLAQADSLSKVFRGLSFATEYEPTLVPTFNASAGALNRGVSRGQMLFGNVEKNNLMAAAFLGVSTSTGGSEQLEPGVAELNEALAMLIEGKPLQTTALKKVWREILRVLAVTATQTALAEALAMSLTPDMAFLPDVERRLMLEGALNYPVIGFAIQKQSLLALRAMKEDVQRGKISTQKFNEIRARSLDPLISQILVWDALKIHPAWMRGVAELGLLSDDDVEKKLPKHVLTLLETWDQNLKGVNEKTRPEDLVQVAARSFFVHWTLSSGYLPPLAKWVKRYESESAAEEEESN